jgi:hypothetical protein
MRNKLFPPNVAQSITQGVQQQENHHKSQYLFMVIARLVGNKTKILTYFPEIISIPESLATKILNFSNFEF